MSFLKVHLRKWIESTDQSCLDTRVGDGVLEVETDLDKVIDLTDQLVEEAVRLETIEDSQTAREVPWC